ncbi:MAG TPA: class I SAM-dependent methyltransferase [Ilumatobacteraceae bacterium]
MDADEYRRIAESSERHWWYLSTRALLRELIEPRLDPAATLPMLDAAGGTGATGGWLTGHGPLTIADYEPFALGIARADHSGCLPARADINHLPFTCDSFSVVLCVTALYHRMNADPAATVGEFARVAAPGALVVLMEPSGRHLRRSHDTVTHTARRFSVKDMRALATNAGLDVERATAAYSFLLPPAAVLSVLQRNSTTSDVDRSPSGLGGTLGFVAALERRVLRRFDIPFGLSAIVVARRPST